MAESETELAKPDGERPAKFQYSVTWSSIFESAAAPQSLEVASSHRLPTVVPRSRELRFPKEEYQRLLDPLPDPPMAATPAREPVISAIHSSTAAEEMAMVAQVPERVLHSAPRMGDPNFSSTWEMVVPKMARPAPSAPKALPLESKELIEASKPQRKPAAWLSLIAILAVLLGFLALYRWLFTPRGVAPVPEIAALNLAAEPMPNGLVDIRWNPASAPVVGARQGRLLITEPQRPLETLRLESDQLKAGHLAFQPLGDRVGFQMEVTDDSGVVTKGSVTTQRLTSGGGRPPRKTMLASHSSPHPGETASGIASGQKSAASRPLLPPFIPAVNHDTPTGEQAVLLDAPVPVRVPDPDERPTRPEEPGNRTVATGNTLPAASAPVAGSNLQSAKLIKSVKPIYPLMAKNARIEGIVRFKAIIGKDGKVQNLQLVSGPTELVNAANDAVKQWVYQPMLLNGQPTESVMQIDVLFKLDN